jgi:hypothetical protein
VFTALNREANTAEGGDEFPRSVDSQRRAAVARSLSHAAHRFGGHDEQVRRTGGPPHTTVCAPPRYPPADLAIISGSLFDGPGVYRFIEPSFTNDQTLRTVLEFMSAAVRIDQDATESGRPDKPVADAP